MMYISVFEKLDLYYGYIYIYIYIIQYRDQRRAPLSPPTLSKSVLSWDMKLSCESTAFTSLPPRRLMRSAKKKNTRILMSSCFWNNQYCIQWCRNKWREVYSHKKVLILMWCFKSWICLNIPDSSTREQCLKKWCLTWDLCASGR